MKHARALIRRRRIVFHESRDLASLPGVARPAGEPLHAHGLVALEDAPAEVRGARQEPGVRGSGVAERLGHLPE
jgi:hypothetical protein